VSQHFDQLKSMVSSGAAIRRAASGAGGGGGPRTSASSCLSIGEVIISDSDEGNGGGGGHLSELGVEEEDLYHPQPTVSEGGGRSGASALQLRPGGSAAARAGGSRGAAAGGTAGGRDRRVWDSAATPITNGATAVSRGSLHSPANARRTLQFRSLSGGGGNGPAGVAPPDTPPNTTPQPQRPLLALGAGPSSASATQHNRQTTLCLPAPPQHAGPSSRSDQYTLYRRSSAGGGAIDAGGGHDHLSVAPGPQSAAPSTGHRMVSVPRSRAGIHNANGVSGNIAGPGSSVGGLQLRSRAGGVVSSGGAAVSGASGGKAGPVSTPHNGALIVAGPRSNGGGPSINGASVGPVAAAIRRWNQTASMSGGSTSALQLRRSDGAVIGGSLGGGRGGPNSSGFIPWR
jgi:hypothetical protein